ncbi:unnamed protein product [Paramecium primaurelia]|uniref:Protein kinase domain-containing protein n=1 Tax=Paramecium primaurelia TaxID=5886 RepID=A0A8S1K0Z6_PARPR|nr:unnamed protein product [Paramecium primaurelia]
MQQFSTQIEFQEDFDFKNSVLLGQGTFGKVFKAKAVKSLPQGYYALKIIETQSEQAYELAIQELNLYSAITYHQNVIKVYKVYSWKDEMPFRKFVLVFAMELAINSLRQDIEERRKTSKEYGDMLIIDIMNQCLRAFHYLAKNKHLFHRDIKPENILVTSLQPYTVKLADFGAGKENFHGQAMLNTLVGTPLFLSPKLYVAYSLNQPGKVKHDLEKSDVFSLGITFLQMILLLNDRDLSKLNDPIIYDDKTGEPIDTSEEFALRKDCQGWKKLQNHINIIKHPSIKACIYGMTEFSERNRFTWFQALTTLDPDFKDDEKLQIQKPIQSNEQKKQQVIQSYSNENTTLKFLGTLNDEHYHDKIISAGNQILSHSKEGVRLISIGGTVEWIFNQHVIYLSYLPSLDICVGLTMSGEIFGINLKNKSFLCERIIHFQYDTITVMKYMRKDLCILGTKFGEIMILAFDTQPPCVIKKYKEVDRAVLDLVYDDEVKYIISTHENSVIFCKYLAYEQSAKYIYETQLTNLILISSEYFTGTTKDQSEIPMFQIKDGIINLVQIYQIHNKTIPLALTMSDIYLVWVSQKFIGSIQVDGDLSKLNEEKGKELIVNASKPAHLLTTLQNGKIIAASDGIKLHLYQIVSQNCEIF